MAVQRGPAYQLFTGNKKPQAAKTLVFNDHITLSKMARGWRLGVLDKWLGRQGLKKREQHILVKGMEQPDPGCG